MVNSSYIDAFIPEGKDSSQCANCGICLQNCPVMKMDKEESKAETPQGAAAVSRLRLVKRGEA